MRNVHLRNQGSEQEKISSDNGLLKEQTGMKLGLVIEGGGMKCAYTSGILDLMMDDGIRPDYVIGVSAGAACGGLCAGLEREQCQSPGPGFPGQLYEAEHQLRTKSGYTNRKGRRVDNRGVRFLCWKYTEEGYHG